MEDDVKAQDGAKTENRVKTKHDEIIDIMKYFYIGGEYKNVIPNFLSLDYWIENCISQILIINKSC